MVKAYADWYEKEKGIPFIWDAKNAMHISSIYKKIFQSCQLAGSASDNDTILHLFEKILNSLQRADAWIYDNVSPAMISSKFNEIIAKIRAIGGSKGNYSNMKVDLINKMFGK